MDLGARAASIGALAEPVRRALYQYVAAQPGDVSRDQAATALEIPVHTAKFHLDRLVDEGLLLTDYRRLSGRTGPGAGRPSKLYRRSPVAVSVALPERRYDLVGHVLATAVERAQREGGPMETAIHGTALDEGHSVGAAHRPPQRGDSLAQISGVLERYGYEPRREGESVELVNCPFDTLAQNHTDLVCGLNHSYVQGVAEGMEADDLRACLEPEAGLCCVKVRRSNAVRP